MGEIIAYLDIIELFFPFAFILHIYTSDVAAYIAYGASVVIISSDIKI
jgi:hypothetical protein